MYYERHKDGMKAMMEEPEGFSTEYGDILAVNESPSEKGFICLYVNGKCYPLDAEESSVLVSSLNALLKVVCK